MAFTAAVHCIFSMLLLLDALLHVLLQSTITNGASASIITTSNCVNQLLLHCFMLGARGRLQLHLAGSRRGTLQCTLYCPLCLQHSNVMRGKCMITA